MQIEPAQKLFDEAIDMCKKLDDKVEQAYLRTQIYYQLGLCYDQIKDKCGLDECTIALINIQDQSHKINDDPNNISIIKFLDYYTARLLFKAGHAVAANKIAEKTEMSAGLYYMEYATALLELPNNILNIDIKYMNYIDHMFEANHQLLDDINNNNNLSL